MKHCYIKLHEKWELSLFADIKKQSKTGAMHAKYWILVAQSQN